MRPLVRIFKVFNNGLQVNFSPTVALFRTDQDALFGTNAVKRILANQRIQNASSSDLRWKVVTHVSSKQLPLSTQRSRLRRRWTQALTGALKKHGMDSHGKRLRDPDNEALKNELSGTLEILVLQGYGAQADAASLARDAGTVVESLLQSGLGGTNKKGQENASV